MSHKKTLGIVSGGQLGRMLSEPAIALGFNVLVLDPTPNCPAAQAGAKQIVGSWKDKSLLAEVVKAADFFTIEIEHIDVDVLKSFKDKHINPWPETIELIQNKYDQKLFLTRNGLKTAPYKELKTPAEARETLKDFGGKMYLKSKTDAYDGRGNALIASPADIEIAFREFEGRELYAEQIINFDKELAVMVAKDFKDDIKSYPAVETIHERSICVEVYAPAQIRSRPAEKARQTAEKAVELLNGSGVFGVEMFLCGEEIIINEIAPRVHNSGHYTMDACETSQFEQHIRAITGMNLKSVEMTKPACVMINILGERDGPVRLNGVDEAMAIEGVTVYIYGKSPTKIDRKMGHINAVGYTIEEALDKARKAREIISI